MFWFLLSLLLIYFILLYFNLEQRKVKVDVYREKIMNIFRYYLQKTIEYAYKSTKEESPLDSIRYANYSLANLNGLKEYMQMFTISEKNIKILIGFDLNELENRINTIQRQSTERFKRK
jgi:hypothetical protein